MDVPQFFFDALRSELDNVNDWEEEGLSAFHEVHLALPIGRALLNGKAKYVVLESQPPGYGGRQRCDLFARIGNQRWYVEVKKGWHCIDWKNKPKEQLENSLGDLWKLFQIDDQDVAGHRVFALLHFRQHELSLDVPKIDKRSVTQYAHSVVKHLRSGRERESIPIYDGNLDCWIVLAIVEKVLRKLGTLLTLDPCRVGKDVVDFKEGKFIEHRLLVGSF